MASPYMATPKATPKPKAKPSVTPKAKATPKPTFTAPTLAQFKQSAAYKSDSSNMSYKEYIALSESAWNAKNKKK